MHQFICAASLVILCLNWSQSFIPDQVLPLCQIKKSQTKTYPLKRLKHLHQHLHLVLHLLLLTNWQTIGLKDHGLGLGSTPDHVWDSSSLSMANQKAQLRGPIPKTWEQKESRKAHTKTALTRLRMLTSGLRTMCFQDTTVHGPARQSSGRSMRRP